MNSPTSTLLGHTRLSGPVADRSCSVVVDRCLCAALGVGYAYSAWVLLVTKRRPASPTAWSVGALRQAQRCLAAPIGGMTGLAVILSRNRYGPVSRHRLVASIRGIVVLVLRSRGGLGGLVQGFLFGDGGVFLRSRGGPAGGVVGVAVCGASLQGSHVAEAIQRDRIAV